MVGVTFDEPAGIDARASAPMMGGELFHRDGLVSRAVVSRAAKNKAGYASLTRLTISIFEKALLRRRHRHLRALAVALVDVVDHQRLEVGRNGGAAQRAKLLAVDEHWRGRRFTGAR